MEHVEDKFKLKQVVIMCEFHSKSLGKLRRLQWTCSHTHTFSMFNAHCFYLTE